MIGTTLGHYRIERLLGKGGMGEVYVAQDTKLRREVALKVLPPELAGNPERRDRFEREALAVAALNHPNIVTIHSVDEIDGVPFLTMELVEGSLLSDLIPEDGLAIHRFLDIAVPLGDALAAAHEKGVTHRDVKPGNVMVDTAGRVKVLDFGLAKLLEPETTEHDMTLATAPQETAEGKILGTAFYMSPEQAEGRGADPRSDVFSLGVLFFEMLTGKRPFEGTTSISVLSAILKDTPPPVHEVRASLPRHLGRIVSRCLSKDPERRYRDAKELRNELEALKAEVDSGEMEPRAGADLKVKRLPGPAIFGIGVLIVVALVGIVLIAFRGTETAPPPDTAAVETAGAIGVMGFENLADRDDPERLGRMLTGLITTYLAETGGIEVVSMSRVLASLREVSPEGGGAFDPALASEAAERAGADRMLVGQIGRVAEQIILTAELVDVASGKTIASQHREVASQKELFDLAQVIAEDVRGQLGAGTSGAGTAGGLDLERALTASPAAYRLYVAGEIALNQRQWQEATAQFRQALEEDPTFALAYYRTAIAEWWYGDYTGAIRVLDEGRPHVGRLPERWQQMYEAFDHYLAERDDDAYAVLSRLVQRHPELTDAWYLLGEVHTHDVEHNDPVQALACFRRVIELDPTFTVVLFHLIDFLIAAGELEEADALLQPFRETAADAPSYVGAEMALLTAQERLDEAVEFGERTYAAGTLETYSRLVIAHGYRDDWKRALAIQEEKLDEEVGFSRGLALALRGQVLVGLGRLREARDQTEAGVALMIQQGGPGVVPSAQRLGLIRLHRELGATELAIREARQTLREVPAHFPTYAVLIDIYGEEGRGGDAEAVFADLEARVAESRNPNSPYWVDLARAYATLHEGRFAEALAALDAARERPRVVRSPQAEWELEGRIHQAAGDPRAAADAYRRCRGSGSVAWASVSRRVFLLHPLARMEEEAGELVAAREHYRALLACWGSADVELPEVEDARRRLAALERAK